MINIFPLPLGIFNPPRNIASHFFPSMLFFPTKGLFLIAIYTTLCDLHCITFHHDKRPYILLTYILNFDQIIASLSNIVKLLIYLHSFIAKILSFLTISAPLHSVLLVITEKFWLNFGL